MGAAAMKKTSTRKWGDRFTYIAEEREKESQAGEVV